MKNIKTKSFRRTKSPYLERELYGEYHGTTKIYWNPPIQLPLRLSENSDKSTSVNIDKTLLHNASKQNIDALRRALKRATFRMEK